MLGETEQLLDDPGPSYTLAGWFEVASGYASGGASSAFRASSTALPPPSSPWARSCRWMSSGTSRPASTRTPRARSPPPPRPTTTAAGTSWWPRSVPPPASSSTSMAHSSRATPGATSPQDYAATGRSATTTCPAGRRRRPATTSADPWPRSRLPVRPHRGPGRRRSTAAARERRRRSRRAYRPTARASSGRCSRPRRRRRTCRTSTIFPTSPATTTSAFRQTGVSRRIRGPFGSDGAMYFDGDSSTRVETTTHNRALPSDFSMSVWFESARRADERRRRAVDLRHSQGGGERPDDNPMMWMDDREDRRREPTRRASRRDIHEHVRRRELARRGHAPSVSRTQLYVDGSLQVADTNCPAGGAAGGYWLLGDPVRRLRRLVRRCRHATGRRARAFRRTSPRRSACHQISTLYARGDRRAPSRPRCSPTPRPTTGRSPTVARPRAASDRFFQIEPDASADNDVATAIGSPVTLGVPGPLRSSYAAAFNGGHRLARRRRAH